ncbi:uncharacterized protein A4U43_C07F19370 [Asparagus officinalis]|uniref:Ankyrin repeat domain-containing protein n=1 Tax=Asparagus officinalis TaxID=4686 RepID=A0A5P1EG74_ASPOF|nr:ankyrin repeat domain-containing protein 13C-B-like [Asparagus officinalis]ONK63829.1 uncharacterized protein A4U43_C07F19370 [Asparagus officinalis]
MVARMEEVDITQYYHSKIHMAVLTRNYACLNELLSALPSTSDPSKIQTEEDAIAGMEAADARSTLVDDRDVPNRDTPLHLAVKTADVTSTFLLVERGADWSLQNEKGWTALEEAICLREEEIIKMILQHAGQLQWAKWRVRLPLVVRDLRSISDFSAEITFQFESSVIPFVNKISPSDTIKIWKTGSNLRADTALLDFDVFKSKRSDHTVLFLGEGSEDGEVSPGSLVILSHKSKTVKNVLSGKKAWLSEEKIRQEISTMLEENIYRPGVDVTKAFVAPSKSDIMIGPWKTDLYHMHDATLSLKSRRVLDAATQRGDAFSEPISAASDVDSATNEERGKKGWYGNLKEKCSKIKGDANELMRWSPSKSYKRSTPANKSSNTEKEKSVESEYTMKFKPELWLTYNFPLEVGELLPLFDILGYKIKPIRRLKEILSTKLPAGSFPVKIAFPIVPSVKVVISFTNFELLPPADEFYTPPCSPQRENLIIDDSNLKPINYAQEIQDPFVIPPDYKWIYEGEKKTKIQESRRANARPEDVISVGSP